MKPSVKSLLLTLPLFVGPVLAVGAEPAEVWKKNCALCHGADGTGDTKMGKKLNLKDYTDPAVQAELTDEEIVRVTREGVTDENGKAIMKPFAEKLSEEEIQSLVGHIRAMKRDA